MALRTVSPGKPGRRRFNPASLFVVPYVLFLLAFGLGPSAYAVVISFFDTTGESAQFNGVSNYITIFRDFRFGPAFGHVLLYMLIWIPLMVVGSLFLALMLHARPSRFSSAMRLIYFLPGAVIGSANVLLWLFMFDPQVSPFGFLLNAMGFKVTSDVLDTNHLPLIFAIMAFATGAGGWIVIFFGGLQNISRDIIEAATIDGCGPFQTAWSIKLPLIRRYLVYMLILCFAQGTQLFVEPSLVYSATLNTQSSPYWSPNQLSYTYAFNQGDFGKSAAISLMLLAIGLAGALLIIFRTKFYSIDVSE